MCNASRGGVRAAGLLFAAATLAGAQAVFEHKIIDAAGPVDIWLKSAGDLNGDRKPDLLAGGRKSGGLVWYENPSWNKRVILTEPGFSTDGEVADIDRDGDNDVAAVFGKQIVWLENPSWKFHIIDEVVVHDIEVADFNGDGRLDIAARNQGAFPPHRGDVLYLYFQESPDKWKRQTVAIPDGEGLLAADLDRDKDADIVIGGVWLENPSWKQHRYGGKWDYPHVFAAVGDFNGDKRRDIALSPSELAGGAYRISWFAAPRDPRNSSGWTERVLEEPVETVHHFIGAADFDGNGHTDIVTASMHQGKKNAITLYRNLGRGKHWVPQVIAPSSSHSMRVLDLDGDGRPDLYGANWRDSQTVELWMNRTPAKR